VVGAHDDALRVNVVNDSVAPRGDRAELTVTDEGPGVPAGAEVRIFHRFERAADMRNYGGLGLGLYIARQNVEAHGGTISVESGGGKGATFRVSLPVHR